MKLYKKIFFDLDHTLWDFETNSRETLKELFDEYSLHSHVDIFNIVAFQEAFSRVNHNLWALYNIGAIKKEELRKRRFAETFSSLGLPVELHPQGIALAYLQRCSTKAAVFSFAHETLEYLHSKYNISIITNGFPEAQFNKLKSSGLEKYFDHIIISEEVGFAKPDPRIFTYALELCGHKKEEAVMIGDNLDTDIRGAIAGGIDSIWFNPFNEQAENRATHTINCLSELRNIL